MMTLQLDMYQACALGAVVYALGRLMVKKISFLNRYCIPAPVALCFIWGCTARESWNSPLTQRFRPSL